MTEPWDLDTDAVLEHLQAVGLSVLVTPNGKPVLKGPNAAMSLTIRRVLAFHREPILRRLREAS